MAFDATLEIFLTVSEDPLTDPEKAARRYRRGDIFDVHETTTFATKDGNGDYRVNGGIGSPRFGYIHITGIPNRFGAKIKRALSAATSETKTVDQDDPELGTIQVEQVDNWRRRKWRIPRSALPAPLLAKLLSEKEITVTWAQAKTRIRRKIRNQRNDPAQDDESNAVADKDLE